MGKHMKKIHKQASTVMDSEGNSDPIASAAIPDDLPEEKEDDHFGVVLYSEPFDKDPKSNRTLSEQKRRTHRYKSSWEQIDAFKEWIQPSDKSEYLAFCLVCNSYLKGASGRNDITKHSKTEVHLKNSRQFNLKSVSDHKSRTLKKRQTNADARVSPVTSPTNLKQEAEAPDNEFEFCGIESDEEYTPTNKKPVKRRNHPTLYNSSWEKTDAFKQWIQPSDKPDCIAYCSFCKVYLKGSSGRNDITKHSLTEGHLSHCKTALRKEQTDDDDDESSPTPKASCSFRKNLLKLEKKKNRSPELVEKSASFIQPSRDDSQIFGDYVASAIRDLTNDRNKKRLKLLIQKSIIEVQETDGESVQETTHYPNIYTTLASIPSKAPLQVASTEEVTTANNGILPVQVEAAEGQYRYNLLC